MFTSRIFRLASEVTFLLNEFFVLQMAYECYSHKVENLISAEGKWRNKDKMGKRVGKLFEKK